MRMMEPLPPPAVSTNNIQTLSPRDVGDTGENNDLGPQIVLQRRAAPPLLSLYSDSQYFFDSNVGLTRNHETSDGVYFQSLGAAFTPHLLNNLSSAVYIRQQFIRYNDNSGLDFDAQTAGLSLSYPVENLFTLYGGFSASRQITRQNDSEFYKEFDAQFGLWRSQPLTRRLSLYYGYQLDWLPANPSDLTEMNNALYAGLNLQLLDRLTGQLLYRIRMRDYLQSSRNDIDNLVSLAFTYTCCRYVNIRTYVTYGDNYSNNADFNYRVVNAGGGLNISVQF